MLKIDYILIFVKVLKEIGVKFDFCSCSYSGTSSGKDNLGAFAWFWDSFKAVSGAKIPPLGNELYISKQILMQKKLPAEEREFASI